MIGRGLVVLGLFCVLTACSAPRNLFVLLPEADGSVGQVTISNAQGQQTLSQPWQATGMDSAEQAPKAPQEVKPEKMEAIFQTALVAQPQPPVHFLLYCGADSTALTAQSKKQIPAILAEIQARNSVDTSVVGHTDSAGSSSYNLNLSRRRAEAVGQLLVSQGVDPDILEISSHGERNPLIPTPDNVSEPRNRRVEVTVR